MNDFKSRVLLARLVPVLLGLLPWVARETRAEIVIDPGSLYESRLGYVIDGPSPHFDQVYNVFNVVAATPMPSMPTPEFDGGSSSYLNNDVAVSNENHGWALGTTFDLSSTATAAILSSSASYAYANAYNEYLAYFHLTSPETFHTGASLTASANINGPVTSFEYLSLAYLYDTVTGHILLDNVYIYTYDHGSFFGVPADVTLLANHEYSLLGETFAYAQIWGSPNSPLGSVSGTAEVQFSLSSVPEPSTLAVASLGGIVLLVPVCRRSSSRG